MYVQFILYSENLVCDKIIIIFKGFVNLFFIYRCKVTLHQHTINYGVTKGFFICERSQAYLNLQTKKTGNPWIVIVRFNLTQTRKLQTPDKNTSWYLCIRYLWLTGGHFLTVFCDLLNKSYFH